MATLNTNYNALTTNEGNPFLDQMRLHPEFTENDRNSTNEQAAVEDSDNEEAAPNSGFVIHVTDPDKGNHLSRQYAPH